MKKQFFSMIAAAAFLLTIGGAAVAKSIEAPPIWFYLNPETGLPEGEGVDSPNCSLGDPVCAAEYIIDQDGNLQPTGLTKPGIRR